MQVIETSSWKRSCKLPAVLRDTTSRGLFVLRRVMFGKISIQKRRHGPTVRAIPVYVCCRTDRATPVLLAYVVVHKKQKLLLYDTVDNR